jgi:diguanylate cyclase (GGDEF)-like protein
VLASVGLVVVLGVLATGIVVSRQHSRSGILTNYRLRGTTSAGFVSAFIAQQAARERAAAEQLLAGRDVSAARFELVAGAFGDGAAVLLDDHGRVLATSPPDAFLLGRSIAAHFAHLAAAERGIVSVSDLAPSPVNGEPVATVTVPFATSRGRRVFGVAYRVSGSGLAAFVDHTIPYPEHEVYLVDSANNLLAASPRTLASTLSLADPALARAASRSTEGSIAGARSASTFTAARVPGTSWRLLIKVPDSRLYASIDGALSVIPWLIFTLVAFLGALLVVLYGRSLADRARLATLSGALEKSARTDPLTNLHNRRALDGYLRLATAQARRHGEPMSVLMIDLDGFKQTNDRYGHAAGDAVLCAVADCLRSALRTEDVYGRLGGDEFLVVMPTSDEDDARIVAERLTAAAAAIDLSDLGVPAGVAMSIGRATAIDTTPDRILAAADLALYDAKERQPATAISTFST